MKFGAKQNLFCYSLLCLTSAIIVIVLISLASVSTRRGNVVSDESEPYYPLPSKYVVNWSYLVPPGNQLSRGTCWIFSSIGLLEATYKHQGIQQGYLKDNEYLALSQEAIGQVMVDYCRDNYDSKMCKRSLRKNGVVTGGSFEEFFGFYKEMKNFKNSVLPEVSCPYQDVEDETTIKCPNLENDLKTNPLSFTVASKKLELNIGIGRAKELIYKSKRPLLHAFPNPVNRYWIECSEKLVEKSDMCKYKLYKCPGNQNEYCAPMEYHLSKPNTADLVFHASKDITIGVPHATILVGYNDEFSEILPVNVTQRPLQKGGLILKNSWGNHGHSLEYLTGEITKEQENSICPNPDDPFGWIPVSLDCIKYYKDPSKCNTKAHRNFGKYTLNGGTKLKCINESHCDTTKSYVLYLDPLTNGPYVRFTENGFSITTVIEYSDTTEPQLKEIRTLPFDHFYYGFQMSEQPDVTNDKLNCGYYFFFYDTIKEIVSQLHIESGTWRIIDLDIKWSKESYERSGAEKNYTNVRKSIHNYSKLNINDFLYVDTEDEL